MNINVFRPMQSYFDYLNFMNLLNYLAGDRPGDVFLQSEYLLKSQSLMEPNFDFVDETLSAARSVRTMTYPIWEEHASQL